jgi:hypothetical protein
LSELNEWVHRLILLKPEPDVFKLASNSSSIWLKLNASHLDDQWIFRMMYLLEDFLEQSLVMKACIGWGWLCILLMVSSVVSALLS